MNTGSALLPAARASRPEARVAQLAAEQWGVVSLDELRRCGLSESAVATRVSNGRLHRLHRGIYAVGHANVPLEGRFLAAVKVCGPDAALSHRSAGALWGFVEWDRDRYPEVTVLGSSPRRHRGVRAHRTRRLDRRDITRWRGIPLTTPARTLLDLAHELSERALRRAVRRAQGVHRVGTGQLLDVISRGSGTPGSEKLKRIIAAGPAATRSELEDVVLDLILRGGLAHPDVNVPIVAGGRRLIPDFRWPDQRLIVEADGGAWHHPQVAREDDAERQALLEAAGERVLRVTWAQAFGAPMRTLKRLRAAGAPPATEPPPSGSRD